MDIWRRGITRRKDVPIKDYTGYVHFLQWGKYIFLPFFKKKLGFFEKSPEKLLYKCALLVFTQEDGIRPGSSPLRISDLCTQVREELIDRRGHHAAGHSAVFIV